MTNAQNETETGRQFSRDPSGYVVVADGRVFRAISDEAEKVIRGLSEAGMLSDLQARGLLIGTRFVTDDSVLARLTRSHPGYRTFLEHDRVQPIGFPYEWSVSMLADAGQLTLGLQEFLLSHHYTLKDATAFNVQFVNARPVFIDATSIELSGPSDSWFALGQFNRMFTFPLLLVRHRGWDLKSYFLGNPDGRNERQAAEAWGPVSRWRPELILDVALPAALHGRGSRVQLDSGRSTSGTAGQVFNLNRLKRKLGRLAAGYRPKGPWATYEAKNSYGAAADALKRERVAEFLSATRPSTVIDAGCNTGEYSYLAAKLGARVIAVDADHDAIEILYRRLRLEPASILPLVIDVANPSPATGFQACERPSSVARIRGDCVLALAIFHHLLATSGLRLHDVRDLLHDLTANHLILEFVPDQDPMFKRLLEGRRPLADDISIEHVRQILSERFDLVAEHRLLPSGRVLFILRKL